MPRGPEAPGRNAQLEPCRNSFRELSSQSVQVLTAVGTPMESPEQFIRYEPWTADEKKVARRAYDEALARQLAAITAKAKRMMAKVVEPSDLWELEAYLTESRKSVDRTYQFRYSHLLRLFSNLMRDGWLKEVDLAGLQPRKIADIKRGTEAFR